MDRMGVGGVRKTKRKGLFWPGIFLLLALAAGQRGLEAALEGAALTAAVLTMPGGAFRVWREWRGEAVPEPERETQEYRAPVPPPEIPEEYRGSLREKQVSGETANPSFERLSDGWLRNYTSLPGEEIQRILSGPDTLEIPPGDGPAVLIYHTHTTESYEDQTGEFYDTRHSWRSTDNAENMAAVGEVLKEELEKYGISVLHDVTQHDYPSYNGAYDRSRETVKRYLQQYPTLTVLIDLHRDAILEQDGTIWKVAAEIGGRKAAQMMIIAPYGEGSTNVPRWRENLRFAAGLTSAIEKECPGLMRPIFFAPRNYNLNLSPAALLFEIGTNGNTLEEAVYTARLIAGPVARYLLEHQAYKKPVKSIRQDVKR